MVFGLGKPNVPKMRDKRDVDGLIKALEYEKEDDLRKSAAEAPRVRKLAGEALGEIGDGRAVEPLIKAQNDSIGLFGVTLQRPLSSCNPAFKPLVRALSNTQVPGNAAATLANIGQPAVEPLIKALSDSDSYVRWLAADALGKIGDSRAVDP